MYDKHSLRTLPFCSQTPIYAKFYLSGDLARSLYTLCTHHAHSVLAHVRSVIATCTLILAHARNMSTLFVLGTFKCMHWHEFGMPGPLLGID